MALWPQINEKHQSHALARLVDSRRAKVLVGSMGFSMQNRGGLLKLSQTSEDAQDARCITNWLSPGFFETEFRDMWSTTFAFQPWHRSVSTRRSGQPRD